MLAEVTAPAASLAAVIAPSGTLPAMTAYPTAAMRWSGESFCDPFTLLLNQTRRRTSELLKTLGGIAVMFAREASPSRTE